jgi:hypothetical protein
VDPPDFDGDMKDWPRIAKLQSDLLVQALAMRQTRVASYMLTKCQSLTRFPWLQFDNLSPTLYDGKVWRVESSAPVLPPLCLAVRPGVSPEVPPDLIAVRSMG